MEPRGRRALPSVREVLWAPVLAVIDREHLEPPRTRPGRGAVWLAVLAAPLLLVASLDGSGSGVSGFWVLLASVASACALALTGLRPLVGWRIAAATCLLWVVLVPRSTDAELAWPYAQSFVLAVATVVVLVRSRRAVAWGVWAWTELLLVLGGISEGTVGWLVALTVVAALVDSWRQRSRAQAEAARERGARADQEVHSLVLEEKARIARDLHDVVAHHMSMVAVQAETAQYRIPDLDEPVRQEFASIAESARAALSDVRGILTVLRGAGAADRAPQPTLDDVEALVETARSVGTPVDLAVGGERRPLRTAVEIGAFRILQESLANAARHAPGAPVAVVLWYGESELEVTVTNGAPPDAVVPVDEGEGEDDEGETGAVGGHGLVGMRERTALLGGQLVAGPTSAGGFRVAARLPIEAVEP